MRTCPGYFNSHPHEEDDLCKCGEKKVRWYFNSHPHEEDDGKPDITNDSEYISTHILTKRMTPRNTKSFSNGRYFNSHPHEEDDRRYVCRCECCPIFQLTSSRGGWQNLMKQGKITEVFQLTSSRRGWQSLTYRNSAVLLFQLTSSRRGWLSLNVNSQQASLFQLTSSRRGWL